MGGNMASLGGQESRRFRRRGGHVIAACAALVLAVAATTAPASAAKPPPPPPPPSDAAVAYQVNALHDGAQSDSIAPPLAQTWAVDLGGPVSYPLIAQGDVYVTVPHTSGYGTNLYALDLATGAIKWGPVDLGGTYFWSGATYDGGKVFTVNYDGQMRAFDAGTGASVWTTQLPGQYAFSSPPTATNGVVYTGGAGIGGTVYAVDESSGAVIWTNAVANGDDSSPAVTSQGVYVSYACQQAYDFTPSTGAQLWHHTTYCSGGGGKTPAVHNGRVYIRDFLGNLALDAATGSELGTFASGPIPAFAGTSGYFLNGSTLEARDLGTNNLLWSFTGDGQLTSAPIVANGYVFEGSATGNVYALSAATGQQVWSANAGAAIAGPDEQNVSQPLTGLAVGQGHLVVPASTRVVSFAQTPDFTVSAASTMSVRRGRSGSTPVTVTANSLFSGSVHLTATGAPLLSSASLSPGTVKVNPGQSASSTLTVSVFAAQRTDFDVTVQACGSTLCHSAVVHVQVR